MKIFNFTNIPHKDKTGTSNDLLFFLKPETSLLKNNMPFFLPDFSNDIRCNMGIIIKICKLGKNIKDKFAHTYYNEFGICINFIAFDLLKKIVKKRLPWDSAVSFDGSTAIGNFSPYNKSLIPSNIDFKMIINNKIVAMCTLSELKLSFDKAIEIVSEFYTLKIGDYLIIETHEFDSPIRIDDMISGFISGEKKIEFKIK